jgi:hypothetical protein
VPSPRPVPGHGDAAISEPHRQFGGDGKLVVDQLGHTLDLNQNAYRQSSVESRSVIDRLVIASQLQKRLLYRPKRTRLSERVSGLPNKPLTR